MTGPRLESESSGRTSVIDCVDKPSTSRSCGVWSKAAAQIADIGVRKSRSIITPENNHNFIEEKNYSWIYLDIITELTTILLLEDKVEISEEEAPRLNDCIKSVSTEK